MWKCTNSSSLCSLLLRHKMLQMFWLTLFIISDVENGYEKVQMPDCILIIYIYCVSYAAHFLRKRVMNCIFEWSVRCVTHCIFHLLFTTFVVTTMRRQQCATKVCTRFRSLADEPEAYHYLVILCGLKLARNLLPTRESSLLRLYCTHVSCHRN